MLLTLSLAACETNNSPEVLTCEEGYVVVDGECKLEEVDPLVCDEGYHEEEGQCVEDEDEPLVCDDGYHEENGQCVLDEVDPVVCDEGYHEEDGACVIDEVICDLGFSLVDGTCVDDDEIYFYNQLGDHEKSSFYDDFDFTGTTVIEAYELFDFDVVEYVVYKAVFEGDWDDVTYLIAVDADGVAAEFKVIESSESSQYGGEIEKTEYRDRIVGLNYNNFIYNQVDVIVGATVTSDALLASFMQLFTFHKNVYLEIEDEEFVYCSPGALDCIERVEELIATMTLLEKAAQMVQAERGHISPAQVTQYGIGSILSGGGSHPTGYADSADVWYTMYKSYQDAALLSSSEIPLIYGIDAVHGNNNLFGATIFPHNIGLGAANDPDLMFRIGEATAKEMKVTGISWNFAPALSVVQDISWGRTYEGFSENPEIHDNLTYQTIMGMQQFGVSATAKHFLGDGGTVGGIDQGNTVGTEELIRALHLAPYYEALRADVDTVMISYSSINGEKLHGYDYWINDVLKDELGFKGFVISDWNAIHQLPGSYYDQIVNSVNAGVDMLMEPYSWENAINTIYAAVNDGAITEERVDDAVRRILTIKHKRGLFDDPTHRLDVQTNLNTTEHQDLAREAVRKSLVLLKNENDVLPLAKNESIYITGPGANNVGLQCGGWTRYWQGTSDVDLGVGSSILDAFTDVLTQNGAGIVSDYADADTVVVVLAENPYSEGVGDNDVLTLTGGNAHSGNAAALAIAEAAHNEGKTVIGILISGRPLLLEDHLDYFDGFIAAWLPGTEGGTGISDVVFGDYDFTGKLSFTWPNDISQLGYTSNDETYDPNSVLFPYGYGLTYSN